MRKNRRKRKTKRKTRERKRVKRRKRMDTPSPAFVCHVSFSFCLFFLLSCFLACFISFSAIFITFFLHVYFPLRATSFLPLLPFSFLYHAFSCFIPSSSIFITFYIIFGTSVFLSVLQVFFICFRILCPVFCYGEF